MLPRHVYLLKLIQVLLQLLCQTIQCVRSLDFELLELYCLNIALLCCINWCIKTHSLPLFNVNRLYSSFMFRAPSVYLGCTAAWRLIVPALCSILTVPTVATRCLSASYTTWELQAAKGGTICGQETWPVNFA